MQVVGSTKEVREGDFEGRDACTEGEGKAGLEGRTEREGRGAAAREEASFALGDLNETAGEPNGLEATGLDAGRAVEPLE